MLKLTDISFSYKKKVLKSINLYISCGELVCLVGSNGCGKTTLIKIIKNILIPEKGEVLVLGISNRSEKVQRHMMYLPSDECLPLFLTGLEYIQLMCNLYGIIEDENLLKRLLDYYQMNNEISNIIESYSHGMRKKLQLIVAFLVQPELLIIDETLNGIDIESREITKCLLELYVKKGKSVLLCTHDFSLVESLSARAVLINEGKICYDSIEYLKKQQSLENLFYNIISKGDKNYAL